MAASSSKPVVRKPRASTGAKRAAKPVAEALEATPTAKSKGKRVRGEPTVPVEKLALDRRNPFAYGGRIHAFFQAFLNGKGVATLDEMTQACLDLSEAYGITDTKEAIRRDLLNQVWNWSQGKWGLTVTRDPEVRSRYTCIRVQGEPWKTAVGRKRA